MLKRHPLYPEIAALLRLRRSVLGLQQREIAAQLRTNQSTYARWEAVGKVPPLARTRLAELLEVSPTLLVPAQGAYQRAKGRENLLPLLRSVLRSNIPSLSLEQLLLLVETRRLYGVELSPVLIKASLNTFRPPRATPNRAQRVHARGNR